MTKTAPLSFPYSFFVFFLSHSHFFLSTSHAFCKCHSFLSFFKRVRKTLIWTNKNNTQICCSHLLFQEKYTSQKEENGQQWPDLENDSVFYTATYVQNYHMEFPSLHKSRHTQICSTLYFKSAKFLRGPPNLIITRLNSSDRSFTAWSVQTFLSI